MKTGKNMNNLQIAELLRAVSASYQIENSEKNKFRIIAYNRAADAIEHLGTEAKDIWDEGKLSDISGVGSSIAEHLSEIFKTGKSKHFEDVLKNTPKAALTLMELDGVGPKNAYKLTKSLNLPDKNTLKALKKHATDGRIAELDGFGEESQSDILRSIEEFKDKPDKRMLLSKATEHAENIIEWMKKNKDVERIDTLGSLRRKAPTVGDVDLSVKTKKPVEVLEHFTKYPDKLRIINKGEKSSSILLGGGIRADLKVGTPESYGALLQHFTGSKHHNIALRELALKKGMSLNEEGIKIKGKLVPYSTEESFYKKLGMEWIPPELREGKEEINSAKSKKLPNLIDLKDIKGDLQIHSDFDIETSHDVGSSSMKEIAKKADELGYEYIAFTEHNPSQRNHNSDDIKKLLDKKKNKIITLNEYVKKSMKNLKVVFNSLEVDILPTGKLAIDDKALEILDFALVSIHSSFKQSRKEMTKRVLDALARPQVKIFAHPTARILNKRESIELNWEKIFEFCKEKNIFIEINADPNRLDLPDFLIVEGVRHGVNFTLGTDSHNVKGMENMPYGVYMARRGWVQKENLLNTLSARNAAKKLLN